MGKFALVIGVSGNQDFPVLQSVKRQASLVTKQLENRGFHVISLANGINNVSEVTNALSDLYSKKKSDDITLFYYLGHGIYEDKKLFLTTNLPSYNENQPKVIIGSHLIDISSLLNLLLIKNAANTCYSNYVILDCCNSGKINLPRTERLGSFCIMTSTTTSSEEQEAIANYGKDAELLFTKKFLECLATGNSFSFQDLFGVISNQVEEESTKLSRYQSPSFVYSKNFTSKDKLLFGSAPHGENYKNNYKTIENLFFDIACSELQVGYFFPYAYLLESEKNYEYSTRLSTLYEEVNKIKDFNLSQLHQIISRYLVIFKNYENKYIRDKNSGQADAYVSQYLKDLDNDTKSKVTKVCQSIGREIDRFKSHTSENPETNKIHELAEEFYTIYRNQYFSKAIQNKALTDYDYQSMANESLIQIYKKRNNVFSAFASFIPHQKSDFSCFIPFFAIKEIQNLVNELYANANDVVNSGIKEIDIIEKDEFITQSISFGQMTNILAEEYKPKWIEELNWAIKKIQKPKLIESQQPEPEPPIQILPQPIPDIQKRGITNETFIAILISFVSAYILSIFTFRINQQDFSSASKNSNISNWCADKYKKDTLLEYVRIQNNVDCNSIHDIRSINLDGREIDDKDLKYLMPILNRDLPNLEEISLKENNIEDISIFNDSKIQRLYLSRNKIKKIDKLPNLLQNNLKVLWLDFNSIGELPDNFDGFSHLKEINISNNPFDKPDSAIEKIFREKSSIEKLWAESLGISDNIWIIIDKNHKNAINLKYLYLANNSIERLGKIKLYNLEDLDLSENRLSSDKTFDLSDLRNLKKIKLRLNRLDEILITQDCESAILQIREIDLSGNEFDNKLISSISDKAKCFKHLRTLVLDANPKITSLKGIDKLESITYLKASNNNIESIEGIENLKRAREIILFGNKIKYDDRLIQTLRNLNSENLLILDLRLNELNLDYGKSSWDDLNKAFASFDNLKKLNISKNRSVNGSFVDESIKAACFKLEMCDL